MNRTQAHTASYTCKWEGTYSITWLSSFKPSKAMQFSWRDNFIFSTVLKRNWSERPWVLSEARDATHMASLTQWPCDLLPHTNNRLLGPIQYKSDRHKHPTSKFISTETSNKIFAQPDQTRVFTLSSTNATWIQKSFSFSFSTLSLPISLVLSLLYSLFVSLFTSTSTLFLSIWSYWTAYSVSWACHWITLSTGWRRMSAWSCTNSTQYKIAKGTSHDKACFQCEVYEDRPEWQWVESPTLVHYVSTMCVYMLLK